MQWRHGTWQCPVCRLKLGCCEGEPQGSPEAAPVYRPGVAGFAGGASSLAGSPEAAPVCRPGVAGFAGGASSLASCTPKPAVKR
jgi:hypothetical protein